MGTGPIFLEAAFGRRAMHMSALVNPNRNPLLLWQQGLSVSRSYFLPRDVEHAVVIPDTGA